MENIKTTPKEKGFTLVELMIIVAIIGILAYLAVPSYQEYIKKAKFAEGFTVTAPIRTALAVFCSDYGSFKTPAGAGTLQDGIPSQGIESQYKFAGAHSIYGLLGILPPQSYADQSQYVGSVGILVDSLQNDMDTSKVRLSISYSSLAVNVRGQDYLEDTQVYEDAINRSRFVLEGDCNEAGLYWSVDKLRTDIPERFWSHINLNG